MRYNISKLSITIIILSSCTFSLSKKSEDLEGKYILIEGKSFCDSFSFKGKSTVIVESIGMEFVTSYVKDKEYLRIEVEPSQLLLKIQSKDTIIGEGFASGVYIKESLYKEKRPAKAKDINQYTIESIQDIKKIEKPPDKKTTSQNKDTSVALFEAKKQEEQKNVVEPRKKEQVISNHVVGAFGIGGDKKSNSQNDAETETSNQGNCSFSLTGRSIGEVGLLLPSYKNREEGKIVINITVDPKGNVIFAEIGRGTNIDNGSMRKSALDAAKRAKFNSIKGANNQSGTITYVYKLK